MGDVHEFYILGNTLVVSESSFDAGTGEARSTKGGLFRLEVLRSISDNVMVDLNLYFVNTLHGKNANGFINRR